MIICLTPGVPDGFDVEAVLILATFWGECTEVRVPLGHYPKPYKPCKSIGRGAQAILTHERLMSLLRRCVHSITDH